MQIVFLCRSLGIGGAERQLSLLASSLAERGHTVTVLSFYDTTGSGFDDFAGTRVALITLAKQGRRHVAGPLASLWRKLRLLRPDIVCSYLTVPNLVSLLACALRPRPCIVWGLRASDVRMAEHDWLSRCTYRLEPALSHFADMVIANSNAGLATAQRRGFDKERLIVIRNAVQTARFRPDLAAKRRVRDRLGIAESAPVIGHVGRIDPMKDHESFLRAMRLLTQHRPECRAVCVATGEGQAPVALRERLRASGLDHVVTMLDGTKAIEEIFAALDVFCLSSRYGEGCPNVILEAMACGVPCAVTAVGDAPEIIGSLGAVAQPGDPADMARQIEGLLDRLATEGDALRQANRRRAQEFSIAALTDATEQAFRKVAGR